MSETPKIALAQINLPVGAIDTSLAAIRRARTDGLTGLVQ